MYFSFWGTFSAETAVMTHEFVTPRYRATAAPEYSNSFTAIQDNTRRASFEFAPATPGAKFASEWGQTWLIDYLNSNSCYLSEIWDPVQMFWYPFHMLKITGPYTSTLVNLILACFFFWLIVWYKMKPCIWRNAKDGYLRLNYFPWRIRLDYLVWPMQISSGIQWN